MRTCSVIAVVLATLVGGEISRAQDKPVRDTIVGTWVVKSLKVNNEEYTDSASAYQIGSFYKFRKDGTCLRNNKECKYKFSSEERELMVPWVQGARNLKRDVKFKTVDGKDQMILRWGVSSGNSWELLLESD